MAQPVETTQILTYNADSCEFCPIEGHTKLFVCGTYQLLEEQKTKVGKLYLFNIDSKVKLNQLQQFDTGAILDLKWSHKRFADQVSLGQVDAGGMLTIFGLEEDHLSSIQRISLSKDAIGLSLDWNNRITPSEIASIIVSMSNGQVAICQFGRNSDLAITNIWKAHEYEAWIAAFNYYDPQSVYSGADDCLFKGWDLRTDCSSPSFKKSQL